MRVGVGYDSHRLVKGRKLILGGVDIPFGKGLLGHSDGDVLCHALIDAIIGALGAGDIGKYFPDTDPRWKDAASVEMLKYVVEITRACGFEIAWLDSVVIAERPRLASHVDSMKAAIAKAGVPHGSINIKAKTNEGMGFIGREEGMAAHAVCLLEKRAV
ncbi:MAG: 2-C-methyl-D-erythritol 2,4-cyclodiphosphate synthase [Nitrospirae bacterium]|nr:2-C-methyl-D-erythritol 2,4-cyclodiphosphate synthase [Nitrospirota bacterium]